MEIFLIKISLPKLSTVFEGDFSAKISVYYSREKGCSDIGNEDRFLSLILHKQL